MIARISEFVVKKSKLKEVREAIQKFVQAVHVSEPGTKVIVSLQDEENEFKFCHLMIFESEGAEMKHKNAHYTEDFNKILSPSCKSAPVYKKYKYVAGI